MFTLKEKRRLIILITLQLQNCQTSKWVDDFPIFMGNDLSDGKEKEVRKRMKKIKMKYMT